MAAVSACSGRDLLTLRASAESIVADGMAHLEVFAAVEFRGEPLADGKRIQLRASSPALLDEDVWSVGLLPGRRPAVQSEVEVETAGGEAKAYIVAPVTPGDLVISASFTTTNRDVLTAELTLPATAPPPVSAGIEQADGTVATADQRFTFSCTTRNVGAYVDGRAEIGVPCSVGLATRDGTAMPFAPVSFYSEAGMVLESPANEDDPRTFTYVVPVGATPPLDVDANAAELGAGFVDFVGGGTRNPRDGLVTLVAVVRGAEAFADLNQNGTYDPGELFFDEGEPFVDRDDDGVYDPLRDLACCDSNGNGSVDGPNARWDGDTLLGRATHILWTGELAQAYSGFAPSAPTLVASGEETMRLTAVDERFNPLAAPLVGTSRDELTVRSSASKVGIDTSGCPVGAPLPGDRTDELGLRVATFPQMAFRPGDPGFLGLDAVGDLWVGRDTCFRLRDERTTGRCTSLSFELTATIESTPAVDRPGADFVRQTYELIDAGVVEAALPPECP